METESSMGAGEGIPQRSSIEPGTSKIERWPRAFDFAILFLAAALRLAVLDLKPAHFDEGVNGWFVDGMTATGYYHYEPSNFHGPLHFYVLFVAQTLLGREIWVLRLPLALASIGVVAFALFGWRRFFGTSTCRLAALALAVSPGMVFYGRYAIHETWLVLFNMLAAWGILGLWRDGTRRDLWATALGFAGMILTKETWIVHAATLGLGLCACALGRGELASAVARQQWTRGDLAKVLAAGTALIALFYSGAFLDPAGLSGLVQTYTAWIGTGTNAESGHAKPSSYWLQLLSTYEWPALLGAAAAVASLMLQVPRGGKFLALTGLGALGVYSGIAYKTPWCVISIVWPLFFVFGAAARKLIAALDVWIGGAFVAIILGCSLAKSIQLNFARYAPSQEQDDFAEPYVYVQTRREIDTVLDPLRWLAGRDPLALHRRGHVLQAEHHPLLWLLGDYPQVTWDSLETQREPLDADWLLVDETATDRVEAELRGEYFKTPLQLRGMSPDRSTLYLRAGTFRDFFPGREPEFAPAEVALP